MKYSILVFETSAGFSMRNDPKASEAYWSGVAHYLVALKEAGVFVTGAGLEPPGSAKSVRVESGKQVVQDGPYADVKEQLGGVFVVSTENLDAAVAWAQRFPHRPGQIVEIRPNLAQDA